ITGYLKRATKCCEQNTERKYGRKQPFLVDTERRYHVAVLRGGTDQHTPPRALEQQPENAENNGAKHDQKKIVARDVLAKEIDGALEPRRTTAEQIARTPDQYHQVLDHQRQAESREQLEQFRRMINPPQQHHLDNHADDGDSERRRDNTAPKTKRAGKSFGQGKGEI